MSFLYGSLSRARLDSVDPRLQEIFYEAIRHLDIKILCGRRLQAAQDEAFSSGHSSVQWPDSKHNAIAPALSLAIDAAPYPVDWNDRRRFDHFAGFIRGLGIARGLEIRWGGDWNEDYKFGSDQKFNDLVHFEILARRS